MKKRLFAILMSMVMCLSMSSMVFAAEATDTTVNDDAQIVEINNTNEDAVAVPYGGVETWNFTGYIGKYAGGFDMEGRNLTPVKTIATHPYNQYLIINTNFTCSSASILTVQIKEYPSGRVLAQSSSSATTNGSVVVAAGPNMSGKQVQIFSRLTDANGNYIDSRKCHIDYWYTLRADSGEGNEW